MRYLLDTDICIFFLKGKYEIKDKILKVGIYNSLDFFAKEKVRLQKEGNLIPDFDLLIGATSITNDMILISNNESHLNRISNIKLENWTQ